MLLSHIDTVVMSNLRHAVVTNGLAGLNSFVKLFKVSNTGAFYAHVGGD